jgi:hypothetical protein
LDALKATSRGDNPVLELPMSESARELAGATGSDLLASEGANPGDLKSEVRNPRLGAHPQTFGIVGSQGDEFIGAMDDRGFPLGFLPGGPDVNEATVGLPSLFVATVAHEVLANLRRVVQNTPTGVVWVVFELTSIAFLHGYSDIVIAPARRTGSAPAGVPPEGIPQS